MLLAAGALILHEFYATVDNQADPDCPLCETWVHGYLIDNHRETDKHNSGGDDLVVRTVARCTMGFVTHVLHIGLR